jgi:glycopeptide antibiotics resistance protein
VNFPLVADSQTFLKVEQKKKTKKKEKSNEIYTIALTNFILFPFFFFNECKWR